MAPELQPREHPARHVLVVEDEDDTRLAYRLLLERDGWTVEEAANGEEAVRLALTKPPAVMVVDIAIPGLDGWETMRRLHGDARTRQIPLLAVTGHALEEDRRRAEEVGCAGYLVKPVVPRELLAEVRRLADGGGPDTPPLAVPGELP